MFKTIEDIYNSISSERVDNFIDALNRHLPATSRLRADTKNMSDDEKIELAWDMIQNYPNIIERLIET